jgi:hypothetical protein
MLLTVAIGTATIPLASMGGCDSSSSNSPPGDDGSADTSTGMDSTVETSVPPDGPIEAAQESGSMEGGATDGSVEGSVTDGATESAPPTDAATDSTSPSEAGMSEDGGDAGCVMLNVYNFFSWCQVSVNGGSFSSAASQMVCVAPGSIALAAEPGNSTFELGPDPWVYISGPGGTDSGRPGTLDAGVSATTVTVGSNPGCVLVCCPFSSNGTGCTSAYPGFTNWEGNCP